MKAHDLALVNGCADGDAAGVRIGPQDAAYEKVSLLVLRLAAADHDPDQDPACDQAPFTRLQLRDDLLYRLKRRSPCELVDDVALRRGDGHLAPNGRRSLRNAWEQLNSSDHHSDGAFLHYLLAEE